MFLPVPYTCLQTRGRTCLVMGLGQHSSVATAGLHVNRCNVGTPSPTEPYSKFPSPSAQAMFLHFPFSRPFLSLGHAPELETRLLKLPVGVSSPVSSPAAALSILTLLVHLLIQYQDVNYLCSQRSILWLQNICAF